MKLLAGAKPEEKKDYRGEMLSELAKIESKVVLMGELLNNVPQEGGQAYVQSDTFEVNSF